MKYLVNAVQAKSIDQYAIHTVGIPSLVLMERAALAVYQQAMKMVKPEDGKILAVCGVGNNGADGIAAARMLSFAGYSVELLYVGNTDKASEEWKAQNQIIQQLKLPAQIADFEKNYIEKGVYSCIIDAIFGIGLTRNVEGIFASVIEQINNSQAQVLSVDIPSGISTDEGAVMGCAVCADVTVTFGFEKLGTVLFEGPDHSGEVIVKDIGFVPEAEDYANLNAYTLEKADLKLALKSRPINSHKGSFGRVLIIAGSKGMAGAAYFSAKAAYRMGAGLVQLYTCEENRLILQTLLPEAILTTYSSEDFDGRIPEPVLHWGDCIVFGPGLGRESYVQTMLNSVIYEGKAPVVLDADGLRALADMKELRMDMLQHKILKDRIIVTPHLGEMIPLCGECNMHDLQKNKVLYARKFAMEWNCICVLKDARTVVASSDGMDAPYFINHLGNNGMATAGSGDVLTGIIATLAAQGYKPNQAAVLGVLIHAIAGDSAAEKLGERAVTASDIIDGLCFLKD